MKEFFLNYWYYFVAVILSAVTLVITCLKKGSIKLTDTPFLKLVLKLPEIIKKAESVSKVGSEKKGFVLGVAYAYLSDLTGKSVEEVTYLYKDRICSTIESILETPTKKEVILHD